MQKHVRILGWLQIAMGIIDVLIGMLAFTVMSGIGAMSGDAMGLGVMSGIGAIIGAVCLIMAIPNFICGIGLLKNWGGWVIILAVVLAFFNLVKFPWGTAVAVYTFWIAWKLYQAQPDTPPTARS